MFLNQNIEAPSKKLTHNSTGTGKTEGMLKVWKHPVKAYWIIDRD